MVVPLPADAVAIVLCIDCRTVGYERADGRRCAVFQKEPCTHFQPEVADGL
jgi:hypothetical protein